MVSWTSFWPSALHQPAAVIAAANSVERWRAGLGSSYMASTTSCMRVSKAAFGSVPGGRWWRPRGPPSRRTRAGARGSIGQAPTAVCQSRASKSGSSSGAAAGPLRVRVRATAPGSRRARPAGPGRLRRAWCRGWTAWSCCRAARCRAGRRPRGTPPGATPKRSGCAADLVERDEPGPPVEGGVLDALGHHGAGELLEALRESRCPGRRAAAPRASTASRVARSGRASPADRCEVLAAVGQVGAVDRQLRGDLGERLAARRASGGPRLQPASGGSSSVGEQTGRRRPACRSRTASAQGVVSARNEPAPRPGR